MKFALLTTRVVLFSLSFSLFSGKAIANQRSETAKLQTPPAPLSTVVDKTKTGASGKAATATTTAKASADADSAKIPEAEQVVLQSRDISSFGPQWQVFSDYLNVPKGCEQIPLYLTFVNGSGSGIPFQDLRIALASKPLATIKDFKGQPLSLTRNLTGALGVGDTLLTVQAYGPMGAKLKWKFVTKKIIATKVNPAAFSLTEKVTVEGRNFSERPNGTQVLIGDKQATVLSAKSTSLTIQPPAGLVGGKTNLVVAVGNLRSAPLVVTIKGAPQVQGVSNISTAPGQPVTITGSGFSPVVSENQVTFGGFPAQITSCTPTSIDCIVPMALDPLSPTWYVPIKVKTNGMESKDPEGKATINIQTRVF